ncbi:hypothetical protein A6R68_18697 [Neotoma lepida]|uniref:Glyceraldehyde 3-phosphate dehydrogenase catalytic domain-containing protein n=1 Tax=Neotoma lepida TaxID=56216 RepID=A0A1A6HMI9_NEOLE|nr:hypothetical protein A6R68_18697 [Neotoma lepida]
MRRPFPSSNSEIPPSNGECVVGSTGISTTMENKAHLKGGALSVISVPSADVSHRNPPPPTMKVIAADAALVICNNFCTIKGLMTTIHAITTRGLQVTSLENTGLPKTSSLHPLALLRL